MRVELGQLNYTKNDDDSHEDERDAVAAQYDQLEDYITLIITSVVGSVKHKITMTMKTVESANTTAMTTPTTTGMKREGDVLAESARERER